MGVPAWELPKPLPLQCYVLTVPSIGKQLDGAMR